MEKLLMIFFLSGALLSASLMLLILKSSFSAKVIIQLHKLYRNAQREKKLYQKNYYEAMDMMARRMKS